jgi:hypothetical protein
VTALEQLSLGSICLARGVRAAFRPALWRRWWPVPLALGVVVLAIAASPLPILSAFMAPLLRLISGEDVLHFPLLLQRLAPLVSRADVLVWALVAPPCAGGVIRALAAGFGHPAPAVRSRGSEAVQLVVAMLPVTLVALLVQAGLDALPFLRVSSLSRFVLPWLSTALVLGLRAAFLCVCAELVLDGTTALGALAVIPRAMEHAFLPALLLLLLLSPPAILFAWAEPLAAAGRWRQSPELALPLALAHAAYLAWAGLAACAAATVLWLGALAPGEELR